MRRTERGEVLNIPNIMSWWYNEGRTVLQLPVAAWESIAVSLDQRYTRYILDQRASVLSDLWLVECR